MNEPTIFDIVEPFNNDTLKIANSEIINVVSEVIFDFFEEIETSRGDRASYEQLSRRCWGMAALCLAVSGMQMQGKNTDGNYVAKFSPYGSIENFAQKNNIG